MTSFQSETFLKRYNHSLVIKHVRTQDSLLVGLAAASPFQSLSSCDQSPAFFFLFFPRLIHSTSSEGWEIMRHKVGNTVTGETEPANRILSILRSTHRYVREPARTETTQSRLKQGNKGWSVKLISQLQYVFSRGVNLSSDHLEVYWRDAAARTSRVRLIWNSRRV